MHARPRIINIARFLDGNDAVIQIPVRSRTLKALRGYLASRFEPGREYTESEVMEVLEPIAGTIDATVLRRLLIDHQELCRTADCSTYWLAKDAEQKPWVLRRKAVLECD